MNHVHLIGTPSAVSEHQLPAGTYMLSFTMTASTDTGDHVVPVSVFDPDRETRRVLSSSIETGRPVEVLGIVRRRYLRASGSTVARTEVLADRIRPAS